MSKEQPAGEHGDAGLQGKDQGSYCRVYILLTYNLQGVGNTTGHDAGIQDWKPCGEDRGNLRVFQDQSRDHGQDSADQKLDAGKLYPVCFRGKMINDQNVQGKEKSTHQDQNVSLSNGKAVCDAKQVETNQCHYNRNPDKRTAFLFQEKSDDRDNDNVACSDKTCFSDSCVLDTELLEAAGSKEGGAAGDSTRPQVTAVIWSGR